MGTPMTRITITTLALAVALLSGCAEVAAPAAPALGIDRARVSVSGLSSGAYMAQQVHLAFSDRLTGAALFAGGPYACADGQLERALAQCMAPAQAPAPEPLAARAKERAAKGTIAPLSGLSGDRVYVFHGTLDQVVGAAVSNASASIYALLEPSVVVSLDFTRAVAHTFPTLNSGGDCARSESPYVGACGFDGAGAALKALGLIDAGASAATAAAEQLQSFDQNALKAANAEPHLAPAGFLYVPARCAAGGCALHIVFHGCEQSSNEVGRVFAETSGYNRWADAAGIVIAYPQAQASYVPLNPKACWDWWGYTGADYDTALGAQPQMVANLIDALAQTVASAKRD